MDSAQKKNFILIAVAAILLIGALVFGFRDSLFGPATPGAAAINDETTAAIADTMSAKDRMPEPDAPNPPPRGSGKKPSTGN